MEQDDHADRAVGTNTVDQSRWGLVVPVAIGVLVLGLIGFFFAVDSLPGTLRWDDHGNAHGTGVEEYRYRSGAIKLRQHYERGKLVRSEWFKPDGTSIFVSEMKNESGEGLYLREDGSIWVRMTYVNGMAHGPSTYYAVDGSVLGVAIFENGARVSGYEPKPSEQEGN